MTISFNGLASGLDTSSWITSLTALKQAKVSSLQTQKENVISAQSTLSSIKSFFSAFRSKIEKITDAKFNISSLDIFAKKVAASSNVNIATASVKSDAEEGIYKLKVDQLASKTKVNSGYRTTKATTVISTAQTDSYLKNLGIRSGDIKVTYNDGSNTTLSINANSRMSDLLSQFREIGVEANYNNRTGIFNFNLGISAVEDIGGTNFVDALHLIGINHGYTGDAIQKTETHDEYHVADLNTKLKDLGVSTTAPNNKFNVVTSEGTHEVSLEENDTIGDLLDAFEAMNISANFADGVFRLNNAYIDAETDTAGIVEAFGLSNSIVSQVQGSDGLSYATTLIGTTVAGTNTVIGNLASATQHGEYVINLRSGNDDIVGVTINTESTTIGDFISAVNNASSGINATFTDGVLSIEDGWIVNTGGFDLYGTFGLSYDNNNPAVNNNLVQYTVTTSTTHTVDETVTIPGTDTTTTGSDITGSGVISYETVTTVQTGNGETTTIGSNYSGGANTYGSVVTTTTTTTYTGSDSGTIGINMTGGANNEIVTTIPGNNGDTVGITYTGGSNSVTTVTTSVTTVNNGASTVGNTYTGEANTYQTVTTTVTTETIPGTGASTTGMNMTGSGVVGYETVTTTTTTQTIANVETIPGSTETVSTSLTGNQLMVYNVTTAGLSQTGTIPGTYTIGKSGTIVSNNISVPTVTEVEELTQVSDPFMVSASGTACIEQTGSVMNITGTWGITQTSGTLTYNSVTTTTTTAGKAQTGATLSYSSVTYQTTTSTTTISTTVDSGHNTRTIQEYMQTSSTYSNAYYGHENIGLGTYWTSQNDAIRSVTVTGTTTISSLYGGHWYEDDIICVVDPSSNSYANANGDLSDSGCHFFTVTTSTTIDELINFLDDHGISARLETVQISSTSSLYNKIKHGNALGAYENYIVNFVIDGNKVGTDPNNPYQGHFGRGWGDGDGVLKTGDFWIDDNDIDHDTKAQNGSYIHTFDINENVPGFSKTTKALFNGLIGANNYYASAVEVTTTPDVYECYWEHIWTRNTVQTTTTTATQTQTATGSTKVKQFFSNAGSALQNTTNVIQTNNGNVTITDNMTFSQLVSALQDKGVNAVFQNNAVKINAPDGSHSGYITGQSGNILTRLGLSSGNGSSYTTTTNYNTQVINATESMRLKDLAQYNSNFETAVLTIEQYNSGPKYVTIRCEQTISEVRSKLSQAGISTRFANGRLRINAGEAYIESADTEGFEFLTMLGMHLGENYSYQSNVNLADGRHLNEIRLDTMSGFSAGQIQLYDGSTIDVAQMLFDNGKVTVEDLLGELKNRMDATYANGRFIIGRNGDDKYITSISSGLGNFLGIGAGDGISYNAGLELAKGDRALAECGYDGEFLIIVNGKDINFDSGKTLSEIGALLEENGVGYYNEEDSKFVIEGIIDYLQHDGTPVDSLFGLYSCENGPVEGITHQTTVRFKTVNEMKLGDIGVTGNSSITFFDRDTMTSNTVTFSQNTTLNSFISQCANNLQGANIQYDGVNGAIKVVFNSNTGKYIESMSSNMSTALGITPGNGNTYNIIGSSLHDYDTKLDEIGITSSVTIEMSDGAIHTFDGRDTIGDIRSFLSSYIGMSVNGQNVSLIKDPDNYITSMSPQLEAALGIKSGLGYTYGLANQSATADSSASLGELGLIRDVSSSTIYASATKTMAELGYQAGVIHVNNGMDVEFSADTRLGDLLNGIGWTFKSGSTTQIKNKNGNTIVSIDAIDSNGSYQSSIFFNNISRLAVESVNGSVTLSNGSTLTFDSDNTVADVLSELSSNGVSATFSNGRLSIAGDSSTYITNIEMSLASALGIPTSASSYSHVNSTPEQTNTTYTTQTITDTSTDFITATGAMTLGQLSAGLGIDEFSGTIGAGETVVFNRISTAVGHPYNYTIDQDGRILTYNGRAANESDNMYDVFKSMGLLSSSYTSNMEFRVSAPSETNIYVTKDTTFGQFIQGLHDLRVEVELDNNGQFSLISSPTALISMNSTLANCLGIEVGENKSYKLRSKEQRTFNDSPAAYDSTLADFLGLSGNATITIDGTTNITINTAAKLKQNNLLTDLELDGLTDSANFNNTLKSYGIKSYMKDGVITFENNGSHTITFSDNLTNALGTGEYTITFDDGTNFDFNVTSTLNDVVSALNNKGFSASINNGIITVNENGSGHYIESISEGLASILHLTAGNGQSYTIDPGEGATYNTTTQVSTQTVTATGNTALSKLGLTSGTGTITFGDGTYATFRSTSTLNNIKNSLATKGITASITNTGAIAITGYSGTNYIASISSNLSNAINLDAGEGTSYTVTGGGPHTQTQQITTTVAATAITALRQLGFYDTGTITFGDGTQINPTRYWNLGGLINMLATKGITASVTNTGAIAITGYSGDNYIESISSNLASAIHLDAGENISYEVQGDYTTVTDIINVTENTTLWELAGGEQSSHITVGAGETYTSRKFETFADNRELVMGADILTGFHTEYYNDRIFDTFGHDYNGGGYLEFGTSGGNIIVNSTTTWDDLINALDSVNIRAELVDDGTYQEFVVHDSIGSINYIDDSAGHFQQPGAGPTTHDNFFDKKLTISDTLRDFEIQSFTVAIDGTNYVVSDDTALGSILTNTYHFDGCIDKNYGENQLQRAMRDKSIKCYIEDGRICFENNGTATLEIITSDSRELGFDACVGAIDFYDGSILDELNYRYTLGDIVHDINSVSGLTATLRSDGGIDVTTDGTNYITNITGGLSDLIHIQAGNGISYLYGSGNTVTQTSETTSVMTLTATGATTLGELGLFDCTLDPGEVISSDYLSSVETPEEYGVMRFRAEFGQISADDVMYDVFRAQGLIGNSFTDNMTFNVNTTTAPIYITENTTFGQFVQALNDLGIEANLDTQHGYIDIARGSEPSPVYITSMDSNLTDCLGARYDSEDNSSEQYTFTIPANYSEVVRALGVRDGAIVIDNTTTIAIDSSMTLADSGLLTDMNLEGLVTNSSFINDQLSQYGIRSYVKDGVITFENNGNHSISFEGDLSALFHDRLDNGQLSIEFDDGTSYTVEESTTLNDIITAMGQHGITASIDSEGAINVTGGSHYITNISQRLSNVINLTAGEGITYQVNEGAPQNTTNTETVTATGATTLQQLAGNNITSNFLTVGAGETFVSKDFAIISLADKIQIEQIGRTFAYDNTVAQGDDSIYGFLKDMGVMASDYTTHLNMTLSTDKVLTLDENTTFNQLINALADEQITMELRQDGSLYLPEMAGRFIKSMDSQLQTYLGFGAGSNVSYTDNQNPYYNSFTAQGNNRFNVIGLEGNNLTLIIDGTSTLTVNSTSTFKGSLLTSYNNEGLVDYELHSANAEILRNNDINVYINNGKFYFENNGTHTLEISANLVNASNTSMGGIVFNDNTYVEFNYNNTLDDIISALNNKGFSASLNNGIITVNENGSGHYITSISDNLASILHIAAGEGESYTVTPGQDPQTIVNPTTSISYETTTLTATGSTKLSDLGIVTGDNHESISIQMTDGSTEYIDLTANTTLYDIKDALEGYGYSISIRNGALYINESGGTSAILASSNPALDNILRVNNGETNPGDYTGTQVITGTSEEGTLAADRNTLLSDLGVSEGKYYIYNNGIRITETIRAGETLGSFMDTLNDNNISTRIVTEGNLSYLELTGSGDSYIRSANDLGAEASNVVSVLFNDEMSTRYNYQGDLQTTENVTTTITAELDTRLDVFDKGENSRSEGSLLFNVDGVDNEINITSYETFGSLLEKFRRAGVTATLEDGVIRLSTGEREFSIDEENSTSHLLDNLELLYSDDIGGFSASSDTVLQTVTNINDLILSVANYADDSTTLSSLNITSGTLSIYRDGVKSLLEIRADETIGQLKDRVQHLYPSEDLRLSVEDGKVIIKSNDENITVRAGSSTDTSNILTMCGLQQNDDGTVSGARQLYKVNNASVITESGLFRNGDVTTGDFVIGDATFTIDSDTTVSDLINQINTSEKSNATAYWDSIDGRFVITSRTTGASIINIEAGSSNFTDIIGVTVSDREDNGDLVNSRLLREAQNVGNNASFTINGTKFASTSNIITSDISRIDGVTINLKNASSEIVDITISKDSESVKGSVQDLVSAYNELITNVDEELAQGNDVTDKFALKSIRDQIRNLMINTFSGTGMFRNLSGIGIATQAASGASVGLNGLDLLYFDEEKFMSAYNRDEAALKNLLLGTDEAPGILVQVESVVENALATGTGYFSLAEKSNANKIQKINEKIRKANDAVDAYRERLETKFQSMDMLISKMQNQYNSFINNNSSSGGTGVNMSGGLF